MNYKYNASDILQNLKKMEYNFSLTDARKEKFKFRFILSSNKPSDLYIEVLNEEEYDSTIKYIIDEMNNLNFIFTQDDFDNDKHYLSLRIL